MFIACNKGSFPALAGTWVVLMLSASTCSYGFDDDQEEDANAAVLKTIQAEGHRLE